MPRPLLFLGDKHDFEEGAPAAETEAETEAEAVAELAALDTTALGSGCSCGEEQEEEGT